MVKKNATIRYKTSNGTLLYEYTQQVILGKGYWITPDYIDGYYTPDEKYIEFNNSNLTVNFVYTPVEPGVQSFEVKMYDTPYTTYNIVVYYRNRTANSIELKVDFSMAMGAGQNSYSQHIDVNVCGVTRSFTALDWGVWKPKVTYWRYSSVTGTGWFRVDGINPNTSGLSLNIFTWQANYNGDDAIIVGASHTNKWFDIQIPLY